VRQLHPQHRRLQLLQPAVEPLDLADVAFALAVVAQHADAVGELRVVGGHRAAVGQGAEILGRVEAPRHRVAMRADAPAAPTRAVALRRVLDHA